MERYGRVAGVFEDDKGFVVIHRSSQINVYFKMKPYKVLHITNGADVGGISNVILNYYKNIDRSQFKFDFVIPPSKLGSNGFELEKLGGTFYTLPEKGAHPLKFIKELRRLIKNNHYDVVHAHHHSSSYLPLFVALSCGVRCRVAQCHSNMGDSESIVTKFKRYVGIVLNDLSSNLRFACTEEAASHLFGKRLKRLFPVTILPNGVEPENFPFSEQARQEARKDLGIDDKSLVYGMVGRMTSEKNQRYLIDVLPEVLKLRKDAKLLLVGDGPLRNELCEYAKKLGVADKTILAGKRPDLVNMLCAMDVFFFFFLYEGSPVSAVEASANGLPIVLSSNITKGLQVLSNVVYVNINNGSEEQWAKTIVELSTRGRELNSIDNINNNGFNVCHIAGILADSYLKVLGV